MKKQIKNTKLIELIRLTRTLYFFILIFIASILVFDAGNLFTREVIIDRWTIASILFVANTIVWYIASRKNSGGVRFYATALLTLILIVMAGYMTYLERGMASTSTILYAIPLLIIATLRNRHALLATTAIASATYAYSAVRYFNEYFNEGYRIQLWGTILLTVGVLFIINWLIMIITGLRHDSE